VYFCNLQRSEPIDRNEISGHFEVKPGKRLARKRFQMHSVQERWIEQNCDNKIAKVKELIGSFQASKGRNKDKICNSFGVRANFQAGVRIRR
jgi:hypothetical protein